MASTSNRTLLLIPTELEQRRFHDNGGLGELPGELAQVEICGFGPVAAAARTMQLLQLLQPRRVLLVGIAGAYDTGAHPIGEAFVFSHVAIDGIGAGEGASFRGPGRLGFPQWPGSGSGPGRSARARFGEATERIEEALAVHHPASMDDGTLLTTCAASDSPAQAADRLTRHPAAIAEDMEGFAVAVACSLVNVPLAIVRGVSNRVGDREATHWRIPSALAAARRRALEVLAEDEWESAP